MRKCVGVNIPFVCPSPIVSSLTSAIFLFQFNPSLIFFYSFNLVTVKWQMMGWNRGGKNLKVWKMLMVRLDLWANKQMDFFVSCLSSRIKICRRVQKMFAHFFFKKFVFSKKDNTPWTEEFLDRLHSAEFVTLVTLQFHFSTFWAGVNYDVSRRVMNFLYYYSERKSEWIPRL